MAIPQTMNKAKKARNAKKAAGNVLREEGLFFVPGGSAESKTGPYNHVIPKRITRRDICKCVNG